MPGGSTHSVPREEEEFVPEGEEFVPEMKFLHDSPSRELPRPTPMATGLPLGTRRHSQRDGDCRAIIQVLQRPGPSAISKSRDGLND